MTRQRHWPPLAKLALTSAAVFAALAVMTGNAATGSPPVGTGTSELLTRSTTVRELNINHRGIHLRTSRKVDIAVLHFTAEPGWSSGWHQHTGPAIVAVKSGELTIYQGNCDGVAVPAGQAYVERPGVPVVARNEGTSPAEWYTTEIIPIGTSTRVDVPEQCGLP